MFFGKYPDAVEPDKVGSYPAETYSGGGYFYDEVLEYRVWEKEGNKSVYHAFPTYKSAKRFSLERKHSEKPVVLVRQNSYIEEEDGSMRQIDKLRVTEWNVNWLKGNKGTKEKIPSFIAAHSGKRSS